MKKLLRYLRPYRMQTVLAPLFKLLEAAMELLVPLLMAAIIDRGVGNADKSYVLRMSAVVAGLGAAGLVLFLLAMKYGDRVEAAILERLKK